MLSRTRVSKRNGMIAIKKAYLRFADEHAPLIDVNDVNLEWHGFATLEAPSGAGKTTFLRLLAGWFAKKHPHAVARLDWNIREPMKVKFIGLHSGLLPWLTVAKNLSLLIKAQNHDFVQLMNEVGLDTNVLTLYPYQLSLGMYKRVELVIAILDEPTLLLLDEYFTSIDERTKNLVKNFIERRRNHAMTWVVAHEADLRQWITSTAHRLETNPSTGIVHNITRI